jgi:hypothetical protein
MESKAAGRGPGWFKESALRCRLKRGCGGEESQDVREAVEGRKVKM